jgi:hypothetical protein
MSFVMCSAWLRCWAVPIFLLSAALTLTAQPSAKPAGSEERAAGQQQVALPPQGTASPRAAQPLRWGPLTVSGSLRTRMEAWNWFDGNGNSSYVFPHAILRLALGQQRQGVDWQIELAVPLLLGIPKGAIAGGAQGQLGLGGTYFAANGQHRNRIALFPSRAYVHFKQLAGSDGSSLRLGRFEFTEGTEVTPKDSSLAALKRMRIQHRLIGNFAWPVNGRSHDGALAKIDLGRADLTLLASRPTRGVFQVDGWGELDIGLLYGALTIPMETTDSAAELRVFAIGYEDARAVVKTDNRPLVLRSGADRFQNLKIGTYGAHYLRVLRQPSAQFDLLLWAAGQTGAWGVENHRAWAFAAEAGWQPAMKLQPWLRLGYFYGSGDRNPLDNTHGTFFQVLPTPRWYARYPFYNFQNNEDYSASLILRPSSKWTLRSEFHVLRLASRNDLWYQGGGAFQPRTFGYIGRPGNGNRGLGNLWDLSADYTIHRHWDLGLYFASVWGKGVMKSLYPRNPNSRFGYAEMTYRF